uniref:Putative ixodes 8-cys protein n=1 Tax=Ixodes ricinus TaxID=34613 RepID=A0A0K8RMC2_IXORI
METRGVIFSGILWICLAEAGTIKKDILNMPLFIKRPLHFLNRLLILCNKTQEARFARVNAIGGLYFNICRYVCKYNDGTRRIQQMPIGTPCSVSGGICGSRERCYQVDEPAQGC